MTENEHDKLVAKIQFFYDLLSLKHDLVVNDFIKTQNVNLKSSNAIISCLVEEYKKLFEDKLYLED